MANVTINNIPSTAANIQDNDIFIIWDVSENDGNGITSQAQSSVLKTYITEGLASVTQVQSMLDATTSALPTTQQVDSNTNNIEVLVNWIKAIYTSSEGGTVALPSTEDADWSSWFDSDNNNEETP